MQHRLRDEAFEQEIGRQRQDGAPKHRHIYRHIHPEGRIIGKGKRRQRQLSEPLTIDSLGKSSNVIILRDLPNGLQETLVKADGGTSEDAEEGSVSEGKKAILTAEEIEASLSSTPEQKEVNSSLDAMRPADRMIDEAAFEGLLRALLEGYNLEQLSLYLRAQLAVKGSTKATTGDFPIQSPNVGTRMVAFQKSRWQPGITPLEKRRLANAKATKKATMKSAKSRIADQILRIAWDLTISAEEQAIGELEYKLTPWQITLLFDLKVSGKPKVEHLIGSDLLIRSSKLETHRPDGILRVTARRHDAEEIARRLEVKLIGAGKLVIDSAALSIPHNKQDRKSLTDEDIAMILDKTQSILQVQPDKKIFAYGLTGSARIEARRLLLSLLHEPDRLIRTKRLRPVEKQKKSRPTSILLPVVANSALHYRDRSKKLARIVQPMRKDSSHASQDAAPLDADSSQFQSGPSTMPLASFLEAESEVSSKHLEHLSPKPDDQSASSSYFSAIRDVRPSRWEAQLGLIAHEVTSQATAQSQSIVPAWPTAGNAVQGVPRIISNQGSGYETALSYFTPSKRVLPQNTTHSEAELEPAQQVVKRRTVIYAYFTPSPFLLDSKLKTESLPQIRLAFWRHSASRFKRKADDYEGVKIRNLLAIFETQSLSVLLPAHSTDLRLSRRTAVYVQAEAVAEDPAIQEFVAGLDWSLRNGHALFGKSDVNFKLPAWFLNPTNGNAKSETGDIEVPYIFERFESRQSTDYSPNREALSKDPKIDPAVRKCFDAMPEGTRVRYTEIEGGIMGGQQMELSLQVRPNTIKRTSEPDGNESGKQTEAEEAVDLHKALAASALSLVELVTRASRGQLQPFRVPRVPLQDQWDTA